MNPLIPSAACAFSLSLGGTPAIAQEQDCQPDITPLMMPAAGGTANDAPWVLSWVEAIEKSPSVVIDENIPFERGLRTFPMPGEKRPGVTINALVPGKEAGELIREARHLPNPVLVVTWVNSRRPLLLGQESPPFQDYRMLQEYIANPDDSLLNQWFATTCNASEYLREVTGYDLNCLNPQLGSDACTDAIALGLPSVGVPYSFAPMSGGTGGDAYDPYNTGDATLWWRADLMVAIADRSALIRPSLNPTVSPTTKTRFTGNGRPIWDSVNSTYRRPEIGDDLFPAVFDKLEGTADPEGPKRFVGWINNCDYSDTVEFEGYEGYWQWLEYWKANSWYGPHEPSTTQPPTNKNMCPGSIAGNPYNQFPFSGLGLTLNWTVDVTTGGPLPEDFYAVSEFIHVGRQPIYVVGVYQGSQMLGGGLPQSGQVPWYDSCNGDFNMDGEVDGRDLAILLSQWFTADGQSTETPNMCLNLFKLAPDVGAAALLELLERWGDCPDWPVPGFDPACP